MRSLLVLLLVLCSCKHSDKEVNSIYDLRDNVYESLVLSFPDASDEDIVDLYYLYKDKLDSLSYDEVVVF